MKKDCEYFNEKTYSCTFDKCKNCNNYKPKANLMENQKWSWRKQDVELKWMILIVNY